MQPVLQGLLFIGLPIIIIVFICYCCFCSKKDNKNKTTNKNIGEKPIESKTINNPPNIQNINEIANKIIQKKIVYKTSQQLQHEYQGTYFCSFKLNGSNSFQSITALAIKGQKILLTTTKNTMILYNLRTFKKQAKNQTPQRFFVSLNNNSASAVCIGQHYYYVALTFDKTIVYYEFKGEQGVYFNQVCRFPRNKLKSNASVIHVSKIQKYIVTVGSENDLSIFVWSMKGQQLNTINSYSIKHYFACCGNLDIMIHGCQIKIYSVSQDKDGNCKQLKFKQQLQHQQNPLFSVVDNRDMYAVTITKQNKVKVWNLYNSTGYNRIVESNESFSDIVSLKPTKCAIYTKQIMVGHFKTMIVLSNEQGFMIVDTQLKTIKKVQGVDVKGMYISGSDKSIILGTINKDAQILLWKLIKQMEKIDQVTL